MRPIAHIRKNVLQMTQAAFAEVAGVTQPTVSRWEQGELAPTTDELARIRRSAIEGGCAWDDAWFFEVPMVQAATAAVS